MQRMEAGVEQEQLQQEAELEREVDEEEVWTRGCWVSGFALRTWFNEGVAEIYSSTS